ncbi:MAG: type I-E CRISPR-associated endonuclease Cas1e [Desulfovibrionaceae bacterium]
MLKGRLGLESSRIPHADRHGLLWLSRGKLSVQDGTLHFVAAGDGELAAGCYDIPYQDVSLILLGPGTEITHDVFRLCGGHGTGLAAVGEDGVRMYTAPPRGPDQSALSRRQAMLWADPEERLGVARRMYAIRLSEAVPRRDIAALRGIEGARVRERYKLEAKRYRIPWKGRNYDRQNPEATDGPNMALNHAAVAVRAAAEVAVASLAAIPQLGFIHEDSSIAFALDIADLFRDEFTLPVAFQGYVNWREDESQPLERAVRRLAGARMRKQKLIASMIDRIKELLGADDGGGDG